MSVARHRIAITSLAGVMLKPSCRGMPLPVPPSPMVMSRSARSFMSITRFHAMVRGSMFSVRLRFCRLLSISADSRLFAFSIAAKSPVKCRLMSSMGTTCA